MQIQSSFKRLFLCLIVGVLPLLAYGQKMSVSSFELDANDLTANTEGTIERDQNGDKSALIKIKTTEKGFDFDNGSLGVVKVDESKVAEVWLYVPQGSRRITIKHPELGQLEYEFPISIKKAKTYVLTLTADKVFTATFDDKKHQKLILHITPRRAKVSVNGSIENVEDGLLSKEYSFGRYRYVVSADRYHDLEDTITINNPNAPQERTVNLKQAYGWLQFSNYKELADARLFVDKNNLGIITAKPFDINSGSHVLKIVKPLYETYEAEFIISDSVTTTMTPVMIENYGEVSLDCVDKNAEIWIDDEQKAVGAFRDKLGAGTHKVECRKQYHTASAMEIDVVKGTNKSYVLDAPTPICGSIIINTDKAASVVVDDNIASASNTTYRNDKVLIGPHHVVVRQKGYRTQSFDLTLSEGEVIKKDIVMEPIINVSFYSTPNDASLYIDREFKGKTPIDLEIKSGKHNVQIAKADYYTYYHDETFNQDGKKFNKKLRRVYYHNNDFYIEGLGQAGTFMAYGATMGCEIYGFNIEAFFKAGIEKETVYASLVSTDEPSSSYYDDDAPTMYEFKVKQNYGGKIGYAFNLKSRWRIIPQIGAGCAQITSDSGLYSEETTYVVSGLANIKFQYALCQNVSLTLSPEYSMALSKGKVYEKLAEVSTKIKGWGDGFNCSLGLNIFF